MASPLQQIASFPLLASASLLYASGAGTYTQIVKLSCVNTDANSHAVTIYMVPAGQSLSSTYATTSSKAVLAGETFNSPNEYALVLNPGDGLWAFADTADVVTLFASGLLST